MKIVLLPYPYAYLVVCLVSIPHHLQFSITHLKITIPSQIHLSISSAITTHIACLSMTTINVQCYSEILVYIAKK